MANYILAYGGSKPEKPEAGVQLMQRWRAWIEGLGDAMVNPGNPASPSKKPLTSTEVIDDGGSNPPSGFPIVRAGIIEAAIEVARGCSHLDEGTIEVAELVEM